jgi:EamA domain-containing membrane protein RarD
MALWVAVFVILFSATLVTFLALGPFRAAPNIATLRTLGLLQYLAALILVGARLLGLA